MSPKAFSAIILRLVGLWFLFQAAYGSVGLFYVHQELLAGLHRRWYEGSPQPLAAPADRYLHDTYYVVGPLHSGLVGTGLQFTAGLTLLLGSRPLARLLARNLETI